MTNEELSSKKYLEEVGKIIDNMSLMDDDLMSKVFEDNIPATEILLQTILGEEISVIESKGQVELNNPLVQGRNITLDIYARDKNGRMFNCEVQRKKSGADPRRARFHSSMMDVRALESNEDFRKIRDTYVIFITQDDYFDEGKSVYVIKRRVDIGKSDKPFDDGNVIIYVNGSYRGDDPIGRLLSDIRNKSTYGFYNKELEDAVRHFKEKEGGKKVMCEAVEEYAEKRAAICREETLVESVRNVMNNLKISAEQAMKALDIPESEYPKYLSML